MHTRLMTQQLHHRQTLVESVTSIPRPRLDNSWRGFYFAYYFAGSTRALHAQSVAMS